MPDLSVIIVSHNSGRWLEPCLSSLERGAGDCDVEVIVVDNASADGSAELVEERFPAATVLRAANHGFAHGNNVGLRAASAPYVLFLNADTELLSGTLAGLVARLEDRPELGLVGCRQVTAEGALWPTIRRFPTPGRLLFEALGSEQLPWRASWLGERELDPAAYERETPCDWTSGSFMLARRAALDAAGLMDERFFLYCEEPDLCLRIRRAGWRIAHLPDLTIVHHAGKDGFQPRLVAQDAFARRQYLDKHLRGPSRAAALGAFALGHALRAVAGARDPAVRADRRRSSRAALRVLAGLDGPPFGPPPPRALWDADSGAQDADAEAAVGRIGEGL